MPIRLFCAFVLAGCACWAQSTFATITGAATDASGALVPGVSVEARDVNTGYVYRVDTNENGLYTIANIREGPFVLKASKAGFNDFQVEGIVLTAQDNRRIDLKLTVGSVGTTVEVTGGATVIETESARVSDVKDRETLRTLPLTLRRAWDYFTLSPQINKTTAGFQVSFAGSRQNQGAANIDGTTISRSGGGFASGPLLDRTESFSELRMDISGTSAEYGQVGQVTLISRAGTNDFHGTYSDYYSTTAFRVRDPFATARASGVQHRMTFSAGGPVILPKIYNGKNKTFVFGTLEIQFGSPSVAQLNQTVPLTPWRAGDFSGLPTPVRDPFGGNAPFAGNRIPASRINGVSRAMQDQFLAQPNFGDTGVFAAQNYRELRTNIVAYQPTVTMRVDHRFNDKAFIYGRLTKVDWNQDGWESLPTITERFKGARTLRAGTIAYTHSIKTNLLNEARWGYSFDDIPRESAIKGKELVDRLGLRGLAPGLPADAGGIFRVNFTDVALSPIAVVGQCQPCSQDLTSQFLDHVSWFKGNHNLKLGYQMIWGKFTENRQPDNLFGSTTFSNRFTGHAYADFLLGVPTTMARAFPAIVPNRTNTRHGFFVQDDWRITPRLTLNLGLRYDYYPGWNEANKRQAVFDITTGSIVVPDGALDAVSSLMPRGYVNVVEASRAGYAPNTLVRGDKNNIAPRFGFAWRPIGNTTVLRGGFGMYYDAAAIGPSAGSTVPFNIAEPAYTNDVSNPLVLPLAFPSTGSGGPSTVSLPPAFRPDLRIPLSMQYNFSIERQQWDTGFRITYTGTNTRQGVYRWNVNSPIADAQLFVDKARRFPNYPAIQYTDNGAGHQYHGVSMEAQRPMKNGFAFQVYYTLAKDIQDLENLESPEYAYDRARERSTWGALARHRFQANAVYDFPFGRGKPFLSSAGKWTNLFFGGWQTSAIYIYETGGAITPLWTGPDPTGTAFSPNRTRPQVTIRPDRIADGRIDNPTVDRWFDVSAFRAPALGSFGSSGKGVIYGAPVNVLHGTLAKQLFVKERARIRLEFLATNALNHPQYMDPNMNISNIATAGRITATMNRNVKFDSAINRELQAQLRVEW
ncbi:MAG: TonB-dependent receptor [Bryobacteraceae bacterium]|nr:TonB-dependent receptor [Bryobacteraceae bacterium]